MARLATHSLQFRAPHNSRCRISLALMTGQIGRRGPELHPLRGQSNVQDASDMGLTPMVYPDYRSCTDAAAREFFEKLWGVDGLDPKPGLTVVEIMKADRGRLACRPDPHRGEYRVASSIACGRPPFLRA
jgi:predicted molibdopterin-dependent oxidoreductase YjgC